jgi:hypothetical protein
MVGIHINRFGGGGSWHGWGNHHPAGFLSRITGGHLNGYGDDFSGHMGNSRFQVSNISSFGGHDGWPQFGIGNWGGGNRWGHRGHTHIAIDTRSWGRDDRDDDRYYRDYDRHEHYYHNRHRHHDHDRDHYHGRGVDWGDAMHRSGNGLKGFGSGVAYGLDRSGDRFAGGDILGGLGEALLAPIRGLKGMFAGCEVRDANYAEAPQCHGGDGPRTRFLG